MLVNVLYLLVNVLYLYSCSIRYSRPLRTSKQQNLVVHMCRGVYTCNTKHKLLEGILYRQRAKFQDKTNRKEKLGPTAPHTHIHSIFKLKEKRDRV